ncbi:hypothetical protein [Methylobacterium durans]|uniref:Uncharacterized protein n=1 Tax=Methylobacterium durans TaxID=2202825 RepID=A0A2U8W8R5_9HYPH|nr:hypothetical protein [Methylobacterium durans]AWN42524.1 hypothetical protein DK389_20990 [Methylobacterium durans]
MRIFVIAAVAAFAGITPLQAAPLSVPAGTAAPGDVLTQVRDRGMGHEGMRHGSMRGMRRGDMHGMRHGSGMRGMRHGGGMRNMHGMNHRGM